MVQAQQSLLFALDRLEPEDRFNIIAFDNTAEALFRGSKPATPEMVATGQRFVQSLEADGGTEMWSALDLALDGRTDLDVMRQIVFVTDGAVGNEAQLFSLIHDRLGDSRLFTVGIGSAPNSHFMREAAAAGRGTFTHIGAIDQVRARMGELFARLENPVLTDIEVTWPVDDASSVEMYPPRIADLYLGQPVLATVRLPAGSEGTVTVTGQRLDAPWSADVDLAMGRPAAGVSTLWARDNIAELERAQTRGAPEDRIRDQILEVALTHQLVSRYTSLVAIDDAVVRPDDETLTTEAVATNMPEGVEMTMAGQPLGGHAESRQAIRWMAATGSPVPMTGLPIGSTPATYNFLMGLMLLLMAVALLVAARRLAGART